MKSKIFEKIVASSIAATVLFALLACSSGGIGGGLNATAPSLETPASMQNQIGPVYRPPVSADIDPQGSLWVDITDLLEICKPFLETNNREGAPKECQDYWDSLKDSNSLKNSNLTACTPGDNCFCQAGDSCPLRGPLHQEEPTQAVITQPELNQVAPHHILELHEGVLLYTNDN